MRLGVNDLSSLEWKDRLAFEDLEVQIQAGWKVEHAEDGTHTDITCDSIAAKSENFVDYHSGIRQGSGPDLIDNPTRRGSLRHRAMLRLDLLTGTYHNYAPNGIRTAMGMEIEGTGNITFTGLKPYRPSFQKQRFYIRNRDSSFTITLKHESASSLAPYRFELPGDVDIVLGPRQGVELYYDPARQRWNLWITPHQSGGLSTSLKAQMEIHIDGGGSVIGTGAKKVYTRVPWNFTATAVEIVSDASTSTVVDLWKDTYGNFPPTNADSIVASAKPTLSSATKAQDTSLTGWTTSWAEGDRIEAEVESNSAATKLVISVYGTRSS